MSRLVRRTAAAIAASFVAASLALSTAVLAQTSAPAPTTGQVQSTAPVPARPEPKPGQAGKDVIWLPTPDAVVDRMLAMAQVGPDDVVYDLGSGDGRTVIAAAKRGAHAVGIEFDPDLVALSERNARAAGVAQKARFVRGDIFGSDFQSATVVTLYLLTTLNMRLRPVILAMRPGTRVVSHQFTMEDWTPDDTSQAEYRSVYLWFVPAKVEGEWHLELSDGSSFPLTLDQKFQKIDGGVPFGGLTAGLRNPSLRGAEIRFAFVDQQGVLRELLGTVSGERMEGTFKAGTASGSWTATRRR